MNNQYFRKLGSPFLVLVCGLVITAAVTLYMRSNVERNSERDFIHQCSEIQTLVTERFDDNARVLKSGSALFYASDKVTRADWAVFVAQLEIQKDLPGILGLGFSRIVPPAELPQHTREIRTEGFPDYTVRPEGKRTVYSSIIYLEPVTVSNQKVFGYDMLTEPTRRAAMELARDTNSAVLSGRVTLPQETGIGAQFGTLMYLPVYRRGLPVATVEQRRAAIHGWVYIPCRIDDLVQGILGNNLEKAKRLHFQLYDGLRPSPESLLYESVPSVSQRTPPAANFSHQVSFDDHGHRWTMRFTKTTGVLFSGEYAKVWILLAGGIIGTLLLAALIRSLRNTRIDAVEIAKHLAIDLSENEQFTSDILNSLPASVAVLEVNGVIIAVNEPWRRFARENCGPGELIGDLGKRYLDECKNSTGTEEDGFSEAAFKGIQAVLLGEQSEFTLEYPCHDQLERRWFTMTAVRLKGERSGVIISHTNITERKRLEETVARNAQFMRKLVDVTPGMLGYWTSELNCLFANSTYLEWFNKTPEQMLGMNLRDLLGEKLFRQNETMIRNALEGKYQQFERILTKNDGSTRFTLAHYIPDVEGGIVRGFFVSVSDIDEMKQAEFRSVLLNKELASQAKEADFANRAKTDFLATMSHEIRTPLGAILGMTDLLAETSLDSEQRESVAVLQSAGEALQSLIDDILDLSKIEAGLLHIESVPFNLRDCIDQTVKMMSSRARQKKLSFSASLAHDTPDWLAGDPYRLRQILLNLIGNAIKFTERGGVSVEVETVTADTSSIMVRFSVSDSGIGIATDKLQTVFEKFSQADSSTTRNYGGSGLGLSISHQLTALMGGEMGVESTEGVGSCFHFTCRFALLTERQSEPPPPVVAPENQLRPLAILLVDDNKDNRTVLSAYFRSTLHVVECAVNGEEAVAKVKQGGPDLVLLDMEMPVMDGYTAVRLIREWEQETGRAPLPVIALTANALREDKLKSIAAGCTDHITKPVNKKDLLKRVDEYAAGLTPGDGSAPFTTECPGDGASCTMPEEGNS